MKKTMMIIAIFAALIALFTAATDSAVDGAKGSNAPVFKIERPDSLVQLDDLKGEWVLLQFWTSGDASSRLAVREYSRIHDAAIGSMSKEQFRHLAVNFDRSSSLFREIVRRDGLNAESQFYAGDKALRDNLVRRYHLDNGMKAFLINPRGQIVAVNPSANILRDKFIAVDNDDAASTRRNG